MNLGNAIKIARKNRGFKQKELAELCSISPGFLSQIESNQRDLNITTLSIICQRLEMPLPVLFFMALEESDIPVNKQEAFKVIGPFFKNLANDLWQNDGRKSAQNSQH